MKRLVSLTIAGSLAFAGLAATVPATAVSAAPAAPADVADRCTNATAIKTGRWKFDDISRPRDVDWYKFSINGKRRVRVVLGNLPANYAVELYSSCGAKLGGSNRASRYFEEVNKTLRPGTYRVRVFSTSGQSSARSYGLRVQAFTMGRLHIVGKPRVQLVDGFLHTYVEVLNTTSVNLEFVKAKVTYFNRGNRKIASTTSYAHLDKLIPMQRQSIEVLRKQPRGYHHARVNVVGQRTRERAEWLRPTTFNIAYQARFERLRFTGKIKNPHNHRVSFPWAVITGYDRWGNISAQENVFSRRNAIRAHRTLGFEDFEWTPWGGSQWFVVVAQGS
jgi:hypothetical protein